MGRKKESDGQRKEKVWKKAAEGKKSAAKTHLRAPVIHIFIHSPSVSLSFYFISLHTLRPSGGYFCSQIICFNTKEVFGSNVSLSLSSGLSVSNLFFFFPTVLSVSFMNGQLGTTERNGNEWGYSAAVRSQHPNFFLVDSTCRTKIQGERKARACLRLFWLESAWFRVVIGMLISHLYMDSHFFFLRFLQRGVVGDLSTYILFM